MLLLLMLGTCCINLLSYWLAIHLTLKLNFIKKRYCLSPKFPKLLNSRVILAITTLNSCAISRWVLLYWNNSLTSLAAKIQKASINYLSCGAILFCIQNLINSLPSFFAADDENIAFIFPTHVMLHHCKNLVKHL